MTLRAAPSNERLEEFGDEFLVVCPRCAAQALVRDRGAGAEPRIRLTCGACGHTQEIRGSSSVEARSPDPSFAPGAILVGAAVDWYFRLPLWLRTPCCGETLWAYNARHLDAITAYVAADLRERRPDEHGWANASLRSRLPRWMLLAKHRDEVLRCADRLRRSIAAPAH